MPDCYIVNIIDKQVTTIMNNEGLLIVVSGFAGTGKGTVMKKLLEKYDNYALSISATTRNPRPGEVDGREYFFKSVDEFKKMIDNNQLIEHACYVGNYYGTPREYVEGQMKSGNNVILEIEIQGALNIKKQYPQAVLLFMLPPNATVLKERLVGRGTETKEVIDKRLSRAYEESEGIENYDYVVVNNEVEQCADDINAIINSEKKKVAKNLVFINNMREDLSRFSKGE